MQDQREVNVEARSGGPEVQIWTPDVFVRLANEHGKTDDGDLAIEAGISPDKIRQVYEGGTITEDAAAAVAPLIGMTGVGLLTCVNAYAIATQLATGELALRGAYYDARLINERFYRESEVELPEREMTMCNGTLRIMEDVIATNIELRRRKTGAWPGLGSSWIVQEKLDSAFSVAVAVAANG